MSTSSSEKYLGASFSCVGKAALITGASSGIGEHFARVLANAGCRKLALLARRVEKLEALAAELSAEFPGLVCVTVKCDVAVEDDVIKAFDQAEKAVNATFDVVINNAGVGSDGPALKTSMKAFDQTVAVNLRGSWIVAQQAGTRLQKQGKPGSIINITSILGVRVNRHSAAYSATKGAMNQLTKALALEWARKGIRVNAIAPGYYITEMTEEYLTSPAGESFIKKSIPSGKVGVLSDLNGALLLLASDASSNMSGVIVPVDGGHLVSSL